MDSGNVMFIYGYCFKHTIINFSLFLLFCSWCPYENGLRHYSQEEIHQVNSKPKAWMHF